MKARSYDAIVVGAGISGIHAAYCLVKLGLTVRLFDEAEGAGGTWLWNHYPGAMSDTYSHLYRYSWDKEDLQTYKWSHNYLRAQEILDYLNHVIDRHDLRKHMQFRTTVYSLKWNDEDYTWALETNGGSFTARYVVTALGPLSEPNWPNIPGREKFQGELYHTSRWPDTYDFSKRKVGIIGNGSTGVQLITSLAPQVGSLLCFQRHPQYTVPAGLKIVNEQDRDQINKNFDEIWEEARQSASGAGIPEARLETFKVSEEERQRIYQQCWDEGSGGRFLMSTFSDLTTSEAANRAACNFMNSKIAEIVKDPEKRRKLTPKDLYARRPVCDTGYYEQFNRPNVDIINLQENPIVEITSSGIRLVDGTFCALDVLIFATGFDAYDGAYRRVHIEGRNGLTVNEHWVHGARTNMGVAMAGFPNLFMLIGPKSPLANVIPTIEGQVDLIIAGITLTEERRKLASPSGSGKAAIECSRKGEEDWTALCESASDKLIFNKVDSYWFGANVEGKVRSTIIFFGGLGVFLQQLRECVEAGFPSFKII